jgi:hypothetical protein
LVTIYGYLQKKFRIGGCKIVGKVNRGQLNRKKCNQGFSMPVAMGTGLIMLIVGQTLMVRSYNDRVASLGQVAGNGAVGVAEIGLTRYQAFLNRNRELAFLDACVPASSTSICLPDTWRNAVTSPKLAGKVCPTSPSARTQRLQAMAAEDVAGWQDIDSTDPRQGQFRLVSYTVTIDNSDPKKPKGNLVVEGRIGQDGSGATAVADGDTAAARLQVTIPLTGERLDQPQTYPYPGVWLTTIDTSNLTSSTTAVNNSPPPIVLDVRANVFVSDCGVNLSTIRVDPDTRQDHMVMQTDMPMPSLPPLPGVMPNPGQTPAPSASPSPGDNNSNSSDRPRAYELGTINTDLNLPRPGDVPVVENGSTQVFHYLVDKIDLTTAANASLDVDTTAREISGGYQPVRIELYLKGDLVTGSRIHNICNTPGNTTCEPTNFRIYAYKYATEPPKDGGVYPSFCLQSNHSLNALIFAPGYQIGTSGSARLTGTLWARSWDLSCRSTPGQIMLSQSGGWGNQKVTLPPKLDAIERWQRQESSQ